jgi:hypothetical protein
MTRIIDTQSSRRPSAKLAAGFAIAAMLALGTVATPAHAEWNGYHRDWNGYHRDYGHNWTGGYYRAPPVVYGSQYRSSYYGRPYYYPPLVYGPGIGISLPGINIGIR